MFSYCQTAQHPKAAPVKVAVETAGLMRTDHPAGGRTAQPPPKGQASPSASLSISLLAFYMKCLQLCPVVAMDSLAWLHIMRNMDLCLCSENTNCLKIDSILSLVSSFHHDRNFNKFKIPEIV